MCLVLHSLIESLDQLYAGAEALHPLLQIKVQQWALASQGLFPVSPSETASFENEGMSNIPQSILPLEICVEDESAAHIRSSDLDVAIDEKVDIDKELENGPHAEDTPHSAARIENDTEVPVNRLHASSFVRWEEAMMDEKLQGRVKWASLKKTERCIEKLVRSYRCAVSACVSTRDNISKAAGHNFVYLLEKTERCIAELLCSYRFAMIVLLFLIAW